MFKGIEVNILKEETQMIKQIKKNRQTRGKLQKVKEDLSKLEEVINSNTRDKLVEEIQKAYQEDFLDYSAGEDDEGLAEEITPRVNNKLTNILISRGITHVMGKPIITNDSIRESVLSSHQPRRSAFNNNGGNFLLHYIKIFFHF